MCREEEHKLDKWGTAMNQYFETHKNRLAILEDEVKINLSYCDGIDLTDVFVSFKSNKQKGMKKRGNLVQCDAIIDGSYFEEKGFFATIADLMKFK